MCVMTLNDLTSNQLRRLFFRVRERMNKGDGYQPFGYDRVTLWATKPEWMKTLLSIEDAYRKKMMD